MTEHALLIDEAMAALTRYELQGCARQPFGTLSGGQQARFQILLLELSGSTLLLLDEPTDNLDLASAEALQEGLESYGARCWRSPTTAGSPGRSTGSWCSAADGDGLRGARPGVGRDSRGAAALTAAC